MWQSVSDFFFESHKISLSETLCVKILALNSFIWLHVEMSHIYMHMYTYNCLCMDACVRMNGMYLLEYQHNMFLIPYVFFI